MYMNISLPPLKRNILLCSYRVLFVSVSIVRYSDNFQLRFIPEEAIIYLWYVPPSIYYIKYIHSVSILENTKIIIRDMDTVSTELPSYEVANLIHDIRVGYSRIHSESAARQFLKYAIFSPYRKIEGSTNIAFRTLAAFKEIINKTQWTSTE